MNRFLIFLGYILLNFVRILCLTILSPVCLKDILFKIFVGNIELSTWEDACTLKTKCALNAEPFKCNVLSFPLMNLIFKGWRTIPK